MEKSFLLKWNHVILTDLTDKLNSSLYYSLPPKLSVGFDMTTRHRLLQKLNTKTTFLFKLLKNTVSENTLSVSQILPSGNINLEIPMG